MCYMWTVDIAVLLAANRVPYLLYHQGKLRKLEPYSAFYRPLKQAV
jgi:hypothetical protein